MLKTSLARMSKSPLAWLLALSLTGCATDCAVLVPPQPVHLPRPDPALMTAPTSQDYSKRAASDMKQWLEMLNTSPTK